MENYKRDVSSRRCCFVLTHLLTINLHLLLCSLITFPSFAGEGRFAFLITGKITDDKGMPLGEVTIAERGTNNITMSKADGSFTITVVNEKAVLNISHVGYTGQEVAVKG